MKKRIAKILVIALSVFVVFISVGYSQKVSEVKKIAIIFTVGGLGDKSFNDLCYDGMLKAQDHLGIDFDYSEPKTTEDYEIMAREYAMDDDYELIISVGNDQEDVMKKIAKDFPDKKFIVNDSRLELPNVISINEKWEEQLFINGAIAGLLMKHKLSSGSEENTIGIIKGKDSEQINMAADAFEFGVKYVSEETKIVSATINDFQDPSRAMETALLMYSKGVELIQHISGSSGLGVFAAAEKSDKYAFGIDGNENFFEPDHVVASAIRRINTILFQEIEAFKNGQWKSGIHEYRIDKDFVINARVGSHVYIPEDIIKEVEKIKDDLINNKIN